MLTRGLIGGGGGGGGGSGAPGPTITQADTAASPQTVALPALPAVGTRRIILDTGNNAEANPITINPDGSDTIEGQANTFILQNGGVMTLISDGNEWKIESISSGAPMLSGITDFAAADHYESGAGALRGVTGGFSVEALVVLKDTAFSEMWLSAGTSNTGWRLQTSAVNLSFNIYDDGANFRDCFSAVFGNQGAREYGRRPLHIVGVLVDQGTFVEVKLYANGVVVAEIDTFSSSTIFEPAGVSDTFQIGYSDATTDAAENSTILGAGYDENSWTATQVSNRYEEIKRAGRLIAGALDPDHRYDGMDALAAPATWLDVGSVGTEDLTRQGSLAAQRHLWR